MKKQASIILVFIFAVFVIAACSTEGESDHLTGPQTPQQGDAAPNTSDNIDNDDGEHQQDNGESQVSTDDIPQVRGVFSFRLGDVIIEMDESISHVIERIGEPIDVFEAPSCAFEGMDRIYVYPGGVQLYTYEKGGSDHIHTIAIVDDTDISIRTIEGGVRMGSSLQDVLEAYGTDFELDSGMYTFTRGLTVLEFLVVDDIVELITYRFLLSI